VCVSENKNKKRVWQDRHILSFYFLKLILFTKRVKTFHQNSRLFFKKGRPFSQKGLTFSSKRVDIFAKKEDVSILTHPLCLFIAFDSFAPPVLKG